MKGALTKPAAATDICQEGQGNALASHRDPGQGFP